MNCASRTSPAPTTETGSTLASAFVAPDLPVLAEQRVAAGLERDVHVAGAELGDRVERHQEVLLVLELLPDDVLGLALVRRDEPRLRLGAEAERLALGVEHDLDAAAVRSRTASA